MIDESTPSYSEDSLSTDQIDYSKLDEVSLSDIPTDKEVTLTSDTIILTDKQEPSKTYISNKAYAIKEKYNFNK
jgi:hypothetical protein